MNWKNIFSNTDNAPSTRAELENFFKKYNCSFDRHDTGGHTQYEFLFQAGHFIAFVTNDTQGFEVALPNITERPIEELPYIKGLCNHLNRANMFIKFTYETNPGANTVTVHISGYTYPYWHEKLANELALFFHSQRQFLQELEHFLRLKDDKSDDPDLFIHDRQRETFLRRQLEINHQDAAIERTQFDPQHTILLTDFISQSLGINDFDIDYVNMICDLNVASLTPEQAEEVTLLEAIISTSGETPQFRADAALWLVAFHQQGIDQQQFVTITLSQADRDRTALYVLASISLPLPLAGPENALYSDPQQEEFTSALLAYDTTSAVQKQQEFDYMWGEIKIKIRDGQPLDDIEQILADTIDANIAYCAYWGYKRYINERYYEALHYWLNIFDTLRTRYFDFTDKERTTFNETCYYIACCYEQLNQFRMALSYMSYIAENGDPRYATEMIHILANSKDYRLFSYTDEVYKAISAQYDTDSDDLPEAIDELLDLIRRSNAYAMIDFGRLDEAEAAFNEMLEEPENADYAINELAYIRQLREQQKNQDLPEPEPKKRKKK